VVLKKVSSIDLHFLFVRYKDSVTYKLIGGMMSDEYKSD